MFSFHLPVCRHRDYGLFQLHHIPSLIQLHHTKQRQQQWLNDTETETHRDALDSMNMSLTSEAVISKNKHWSPGHLKQSNCLQTM